METEELLDLLTVSLWIFTKDSVTSPLQAKEGYCDEDRMCPKFSASSYNWCANLFYFWTSGEELKVLIEPMTSTKIIQVNLHHAKDTSAEIARALFKDKHSAYSRKYCVPMAFLWSAWRRKLISYGQNMGQCINA